jgi:multiple sugar transport system substrate-binding protein
MQGHPQEDRVMQRRTFQPAGLVLALVGLMAGSVTACGGTTASPSGATGSAGAPSAPAASGSPVASAGGPATEITFWSWVPGIDGQVAEFNASQAAIKVNYLNAGAGNAEYTALKTALETNTDVPDVVQIEFQHLPSFISRTELLNLAEYGASDVTGQFVEWTVAQASQGDGVYAYPQDAGPMIMMCNKALLDKHGVAVPTTWDEVTSAAATLHAADSNVFLTNFTADQGHFFGLLWQSGAKPFVVDGANIKIDFTSPEVTRVAKLWGDLLASGNLSPVDTYTPDWNTALANQSIACWTAGSWGPSLIESAAPDLAGDWQVYQMPQWDPAAPINGNYGGSTIAVTQASTHPQEAETFARWLNTDPKITLDLTGGAANLFPVTKATLADPGWNAFAPEFWGGQETHKVMAEGAELVDVSFGWSPFTDFVYTTYAEELTAVKDGSATFEQLMQNLQDKSTTYATEQGFTVQP